MPSTVTTRPTIAYRGFADSIPANISTVEVTAQDGHAVLRMPSRSKTLQLIQESNQSVFSNGFCRVENVEVQIHQEGTEEPRVLYLNAHVTRRRMGRRVNFTAEPINPSPENALATQLYVNALNNVPFEGTMGIHLGVPQTADMSSLGMVENPSIFQRIYESVENYDFTTLRHATIAEGFNVPTVGADGPRTFGVEIEVDFPDSDNYGYERRALASALYDLGLSRVSEPQRWHYGARVVHDDGTSGYSTAEDTWSVEFDRSVDSVDGERGCEVVSPIMTDTERTWENINKVLNAISELGGQVTTRTGLHVNVGTSDMRFDSTMSMLTTASQFDDLIIRLAHTPEIGGHHRGRTFCSPVYAPHVNSRHVHPGDIVANNGHMSGINLSHMERPVYDRVSVSARAEFRYFDGTLQVGRIQSYVMLCMAMVNLAVSGVDNLDLPNERSGSHRARRDGNARRLTGDEWRESTIRVRQFIDYLRLSEEAAMAVVAAYRQSRWMPYR